MTMIDHGTCVPRTWELNFVDSFGGEPIVPCREFQTSAGGSASRGGRTDAKDGAPLPGARGLLLRMGSRSLVGTQATSAASTNSSRSA